jgi:LPS sulfotransferase NodH
MPGMSLSDKGTHYVVLSSQRSGSTWLMSILNQVEATRAYGELFLKRKKPGSTERWDGELNYPRFPEVYTGSGKLRLRLVFSYLDALYCQPGAVGFKLMYTQLQKYPEILVYLLVRRVKVVHLVRQNQLDVLISRAVKNKIRRAHVLNGNKPPEDVQVSLNTEKLLARLGRRNKRIQTARWLMRRSMLPQLEVTYEDLISDPSSYQRLFLFLGIGIGDHIPESKLVRIGGKEQSQVISNYEEVKNALAGTPFARWVDHRDETNGDRKVLEVERGHDG